MEQDGTAEFHSQIHHCLVEGKGTFSGCWSDIPIVGQRQVGARTLPPLFLVSLAARGEHL